MSPEKVAVLLVTGLIGVLLATALVNAEKADAAPRVASSEKVAASARRVDPIDELTYDDLRNGRFSPPPPPARARMETPFAATPAPINYTVRRGDSLRVIATRELGAARHMARIVDLNPELDPDRIRVGQVIKLPARSSPGATTTASPKPSATSGAKARSSVPASVSPGASRTKKSSKATVKPSGSIKPRTV